ncbi:MAG: hypothetical protein GYA23_10135 [Methanomicrobiales archaeon]|nr:hypothetical protein [Methanomicrobiales archaeon]
MNEGPRFYYILNPDITLAYPDLPNTFIKKSEEILKRKERIVFSGQNVLKFLQIGELSEKSPDGPLADLHALCSRLQKKNGKVIKAFSKEKIEETYNTLISMKGNNEEEINGIIKDLVSTF